MAAGELSNITLPTKGGEAVFLQTQGSSPDTIWRYGIKDGIFFRYSVRILLTQESPCRQNSKN
jgi:hypothetical protein